MKPWMKQLAVSILLVASTVLVVLFTVQGARAQDSGRAASDRAEGGEGMRGEIRGLTAEQLPALQPPDLTELYHFAGALNDDVSAVSKATVIQCTNLDDVAPTRIEVQLFTYNATDVYTGTTSVNPLHTATFESSQVPFYLADVFMAAGLLEQGYGRILTEHSNVVCTVQTVDPTTDPPNWSFDIPVYSRGFGGALLPMILRNATPR